MPPPTDHGSVVPLWYSFDLVKKRVEEGGWTHEVTDRELPSSKDIAGVNMRLTAGSYRELHWHTADEWAYVLYGKARVTVMTPDGIRNRLRKDHPWRTMPYNAMVPHISGTSLSAQARYCAGTREGGENFVSPS